MTRLAWTELGAQHVGIIQSLISTCKLHGVNPYVYLTDVLQRIQVHPDRDIIDVDAQSMENQVRR